MVFRTLVTATSRRIPMIKFRKGGLPIASDAGAEQSQTEITATQSSGPAIEDWELPPRFWRKPISEAEMDYINRGGPA